MSSNVIETTDRNGKKIAFTYDGLKRLIEKRAVFNGKTEKIHFAEHSMEKQSFDGKICL